MVPRPTSFELFDLPETPDEIPLVTGQRVVAIGDIHGNFDLLKNRLLAARLIKVVGDGSRLTHFRWAGGNTVLVQVGDILDRGCYEIECICLLCRLGRQAKQSGGAVVVLWGNHELMNATGDYQCANGSNQAWSQCFGRELEVRLQKLFWKIKNKSNKHAARWASMKPGGLLAVPFLSKLKVMVKVGRSIFVHGGFTTADIDKTGGVTAMNRAAKQFILESTANGRKICMRNICMLATPTCFDNTVWMRDFSSPPDREPTNKYCSNNTVAFALKSVDADRMVVGHTIQSSIGSVLDGKVWRIDNDAELCEALEITKQTDGSEVVSVAKEDPEIKNTIIS